MLQIAALIMGGSLLYQGVNALNGNESDYEKKTSKGVAIALVILGPALMILGCLLPYLML